MPNSTKKLIWLYKKFWDCGQDNDTFNPRQMSREIFSGRNLGTDGVSITFSNGFC